MAATVNASHGVMRTLPSKLDSLLLLQPPQPPPAQPSLRKGEKKKILLLKGDLQDLLADYLTEPSDSTAACWAKEVRELSYDVDDFLDELTIELLHCDGHGSSSTTIAAAAKKTSMIARLRRELKRRRWIADEITRFRARVKESIRRYESYNLGRCTGSRPIKDDDDERHRFLSLTLGMDLHGPLVGKDNFMKSPVVQLLTDGEPKLKVGSVLGFGGVGKTTVATELYRLHGLRFDCRAFVRTSRKPDMTKILTDMLSQLRPQHRHQSPDVWEVDRLIETIRAHLQDKKYFIIIEDLWASSTWDIIRRGLPENNLCSRILITTEIEPVALACCGYNRMHFIKIDPLTEEFSRKLFVSTVVGEGNEFPEDLVDISNDIIKKCGGLPLAITITARHFKSQLDRMQQWNHIQNSVTSNFQKNPTMQWMRQVLNLIYNNLPNCLKACMLYFSIYKDDYIIRKDNLVKQWMAEGFINSTENNDTEEVAGSYFDELVSRGLIQPVDINCKNKVLSCIVHHVVLNFIRCKSVEENFSITIDHSQTTLRHADKVRRLSLHFGNAQDTTPLAGNITAKLPERIQGLRYLQTLEVDARIGAVPVDIVHSKDLLHLRLVLLELLPHYQSHRYIIPSLPEWTGKLDKLRVLNIAVMQFSHEDLDTLKGLAALTALSLHVKTAPAQRIVVADGEFLALKYFMFVCTAPCITFVQGAMPSVQRLNLRFNANELKQYDSVELGFEHLAALEDISARIGGADADEPDRRNVESALMTEIRKHPSTLIVNIRWVDWIFDAEERDSDENSIIQEDNGFCMLSRSSSHQQNRDTTERRDHFVQMIEDSNMQAGGSRQRGEEEMPFGVEGMLTECHTMDEFSYLIEQAMVSGKLVVIEFGASWCEPSRRIAPVFAEYAKEFAGAVFLKVDIDELEEIADSYGVDGVVPTFAFVKAGQKIDMIQGARSLRSKIQMHTASPYFLGS
uniref:Thioredoxin domain-containing protein n=1 Tax=Oryza punctata TaxID=4537 RepID=A0A0E0MLD0_ORYPU